MSRLDTALRDGLNNGLTINEIKEILVQMYPYVGFPRSLNALAAFMAVNIREVLSQLLIKLKAEIPSEHREKGNNMSDKFDGNGIFPKGPKNETYAQYFQGTSYLNMLSTEGVTIGNVVFEPECRNNWHIHHKGGQILLVTGGRGWFQEWNKPARELTAGDVVNIPAGTKHWHGAAKDSWFAHIAVEVPADGASNEWLEPVDDAQYGLLP